MQRSTLTFWMVAFLLAAPAAAQHWFDAISLNDVFPGWYRAVADLDGDGDVEVVSRGNDGWSVHVVAGAGELTLAAFVPTPSGATTVYPYPLIGDFDGDGHADVAWLESWYQLTPVKHFVVLHRGLGGLAFAAPLRRSVALQPRWGATGDCDADGILEIAVLSRSTDGTQTRLGWYGLDAGAWSVAEIQANELASSSSIAMLDHDADGRADLVAPAWGSLRVYTSATGAPLWTASAALPAGMAQPSAAVLGGDFDGDGDRDVLAYAGSSSSVQQPLVLVKQLAPSQLGVGAQQLLFKTLPMRVVAGDWDADGDLDLALDTVVYEHAGDDLLASVGYAPGTVFWTIAQATDVADIDRDGNADLLGQEWIRWGNGDFAAQPEGPVSYPDEAFPSFAVDLDRDGDLDGISSQGASIGAGAAWLAQPLLLPPLAANEQWRPVAVADFDGDAAVDLLAGKWQQLSFGSAYVPEGVFLMRGDGFGRWPVADPTPAYAAHLSPVGYTTRQAAVDAEGDGDIDVLTLYGFAWNAGNGTFPILDALATKGVNDAGDFDADGDLDLVGWNAVSVTSLQLLWQQSPQSFAGQPLPVPAGAWIEMLGAAGDLDADGDLDVIAGMKSFTTGTQLVPFENQGGAFVERAPIALQDGLLNGNALARVLDADLDGLPDLLCSTFDDQTLILRCAGPAFSYEPPRTFACMTTDLADFDRDGDVDLAATVGGSARVARNVAHDDASFGGVWQYGSATAGTFSVEPVLGLAGQPAVGAPLELRLRHVAGAGPAIIGMSAAPGSLSVPPFPSVTLALDLTQLAPPLSVGLVPTGGLSKGFALPIALSPSAAGLAVYLQALVLDAGAPHGLSATRGLHVAFAP